MNKILTALALMAGITTPALANIVDDHNQLLNAVGQTGVNVKINPSQCDSQENLYGWYWAAQSELVICQENKVTGSSRQVRWTDEDYDTVRHEAHHVAQDCRDSSLDGNLDAVYKDPIALAVRMLSTRKTDSVIETYRERGSHIVLMELEAFSVADMNDPLEQVGAIERYCF